MSIVSEKPCILVTAVGAPPGLNALRALEEAGKYHLVACDADSKSPGLYQYDIASEVVPLATEMPREYLQTLQQLIRKYGVQFVLPCIEGEVELLAANRIVLETVGARVLLPEHETVLAATNKHVATMSALECGLKCPETIFVSKDDELAAKSESLNRFQSKCPPPWIVKPVRGHGMNHVETLLTRRHAIEYLATMEHDVLLQEKIPGPVGSMYLVGLIYDTNGHVIRRFSSRSIRTLYPGGGPATGGISLKNETLVNDTEKLINFLGTWRGPVNMEWMLDPRDGQFKFIEINPRLWGYGYLAVGSGTNFPVATVELGLGLEVGPDPGFRANITMLRTSFDLIFEECPFELRY